MLHANNSYQWWSPFKRMTGPLLILQVTIDFVTYSPAVNFYNVGTIIFEISATGVIVPSFKVPRCKIFEDA